ncbi:MAG: SagB/ThcOx family dehydrogenase, partial [Planctomycetota bacterium]
LLPVGALSRLVWASGGHNGRREHGLAYRTIPSAGALYPVETYVSCRSVEGVAPGVYRYLPADHILEPVRSGDASGDLAEAALGQPFVARAAAVFVWTAVVERCTVKYADRGYRYIYMEAGIASENLHLAATALGLGSCAVGAFSDGALDALLGLDGTDEIVLLLQTVGAPRS